MKKFVFGLALAAAGASCSDALPPQGQIVFHVATDAPLPAAPGDTTPVEVPPLFDRLRISVFAPGATEPCAGCSREFDVDRTKAREGRLSAGFVLPPHVSGYRARADLYRAIAVSAGQPIPRSTITHIVLLPPMGDEGVSDVGVFLSVDEVGQDIGTLESPQAPMRGQPDYSKTGRWPGAQRVPCGGSPNPGEVCIPGGAYWWGHPFGSVGGTSFAPPVDNSPHLIIVSPFYADSAETRVSEFRASRLAVLKSGKAINPIDPSPYNDPTKSSEFDAFCTYTTRPGLHESLVLNCVTRDLAREYCQQRGGDLLTDAQHGYVESGLSSSLFVWGNDRPECKDAVFARGGVGAAALSNALAVGFSGLCRPPDSNGGPLPPGSGERDQLSLPGGVLYDFAGNLSEWVGDSWNRATEPCWTPLVLTDPFCSSPRSLEDGARASVRGGSWTYSWDSLKATARAGRSLGDLFADVGIRCARPAL